jgi:23S rRNA (cytidine2498-2'-O)-methyltransferase
MSTKLWAILAPEGFAKETERELSFRKLIPLKRSGDFFLFEGEAAEIAWSAVTWREVSALAVSSINDAVKKMRPLARKWLHFEQSHRGRGNLILVQLRALQFGPVAFPKKLELEEGSGAFTLLEDDKVIYWCRSFDRPHPLGRVDLKEDKGNPPSRAYLKLWEALCVLGEWPKQGEATMDLGSCPGGWTWVLASLGANVLSVDRAPLEPNIEAMPGVNFKKGDAFQVLPSNTPPADWLCSDVICAPEKLLELVKVWIEADAAKRFVCTLKFQGEADPAVVEAFRQLGRVLHLHHNKHELTFLK